MATESSRGILIAILVVCVANLLVGMLQTGLLLRQPTAITASSTGLPAKFDDAALADIARRITEPYNGGDLDALYGVLDDVTKMQVPRPQFDTQVKSMIELIGKVDSAAFVSARKLANEGGVDAYELKYLVKLSGSRFSSGEMTVNILDRTSGAGILGFVINGRL